MTRRSRQRVLVLVAVTAVLSIDAAVPRSVAAVPLVAAAPSGPPEGAVAQSVDLGPIPQDPRIVARDGGASVGWGGTSLWAFGDTFTTVGDHFARNTLVTTTDLDAADGISLAPPAGAEHQDAAGNPEQFTPMSNWENWFNYWNDPVRCGDPEVVGGDCGKQFFHWPGAFVADPARNRLIVFFGIATTVGKTPEGCEDDKEETPCPQWLPWGWSVAVRPAGQTAWERPQVVGTTSFDTWTLFFANELSDGSNPYVVGDDLYVNSCPQVYVIRQCTLGKVPLAQLTDRAAWRFLTGTDGSGNPVWSADRTTAVAIVNTGVLWSTVHFNTHLGRYVMVSGQLGNTTYYSTAPRLWGPWSDMAPLFQQVEPPPPPPSCKTLGNYAVQVHPEYGSGDTIYISYIRTKSWPADCGGLLQGTPEIRLHKIVFAPSWAATWGSGAAARTGEAAFSNQTLRQIVPSSLGGGSARVRISNVAGTAPLAVAHASIAVSTDAAGDHRAAVEPGSVRPLTFGGSASVSVPAGQTAVSDPVTLTVPADHDLAVSLHVAAATGTPLGHAWSGESITYVGAGDLVADTGGTAYATEAPSSSYYVTGIDVLPGTQAKSVIVLGDSLSDGTWIVGKGTGGLWSNRLLKRLRAAGRSDVGVVNMALGGNAANPDALARLTTDALTQPGARTLVLLLGWNDVLWYGHCCGRTGAQIVSDLKTIVDRAHNAGLRVVGATLPPFGLPNPDSVCTYPPDSPPAPVNAADEAMRTTVNTAIRPGGSLPFDAIADFDAVLRDPAAPDRIRCAYAGNFFGWSSHPSAAGHQAMANAINLATLLPQ